LSSTAVAEQTIDQGTSPGAPRRKLRLRYILVPTTVVFVVLALVISWFSVAAYAGNHVRITADSAALRCGAGETRTVTDDVDPGADLQIALLTPALNCQLRLQVRNGGTVPIGIDRITYGGLGRESLVAYVDSIDGRASKNNDNGPDAYGVPTATSLAPGATMTVIAHITAAKLTCDGDGTTYFWDNQNPVLNLSVLGIGSERKPTDVHFGFRGTTVSMDAGCQQ
jgi:hypothetical protein